MARAPTPRLQRQTKSWPSKWTALVLVLVASVMLLLQTEVSVFSTSSGRETTSSLHIDQGDLSKLDSDSTTKTKLSVLQDGEEMKDQSKAGSKETFSDKSKSESGEANPKADDQDDFAEDGASENVAAGADSLESQSSEGETTQKKVDEKPQEREKSATDAENGDDDGDEKEAEPAKGDTQSNGQVNPREYNPAKTITETDRDDGDDEGDRANAGKEIEGQQPEVKLELSSNKDLEEAGLDDGGSAETGQLDASNAQESSKIVNSDGHASNHASANGAADVEWKEEIVGVGQEGAAGSKMEEKTVEPAEVESLTRKEAAAGDDDEEEEKKSLNGLGDLPGAGEEEHIQEKHADTEETEAVVGAKTDTAPEKDVDGPEKLELDVEPAKDNDPGAGKDEEAEESKPSLTQSATDDIDNDDSEKTGDRAGAEEHQKEEIETDKVEIIDKSVRCFGRYVYMYDLPKKFNADYVANCRHIHKSVSFCKAFNNSGMGRTAQLRHTSAGVLELTPRGTWFETDQFSLEILFHARMLDYPCLTPDPEKATIFYVPFFAGLAIFRSLYEPDLEERDRDAHMVMEWLSERPWWDRFHGRDHLFVVTRVLLDFARGQVLHNWGNTLMSMSHMVNATVVAIEGHQNLHNSMSIPYPTSFHPRNDEDIRTWQSFVRSYRRKYKISFGGIGHGMGAQIRDYLRDLCVRHKPNCRLFHCAKRVCFRPHNVIWHYMNAHFCFQPPGDTPTRKGMFDCMLAGGIPVLFHKFTAFRYFWHLPPNHESYSVFQDNDDFFKDNGTAIMARILSFTPEEVERMRENVISLMPTLLYAMPGEQLHEFRDAFHVTVENSVQKVSKYLLPGHPRLPKSEWL